MEEVYLNGVTVKFMTGSGNEVVKMEVVCGKVLRVKATSANGNVTKLKDSVYLWWRTAADTKASLKIL